MKKVVYYENDAIWRAVRGLCDYDLFFEAVNDPIYGSCKANRKQKLVLPECIECLCQSAEMLYDEKYSV